MVDEYCSRLVSFNDDIKASRRIAAASHSVAKELPTVKGHKHQH